MDTASTSSELNSQATIDKYQKWSEGAKDNYVAQSAKDGKTLDFSFTNKDGLFYRLVAKILNIFVKYDIYETSHFANKSRQAKAANDFFEALEKNGNTVPKIRETKLTKALVDKYLNNMTVAIDGNNFPHLLNNVKNSDGHDGTIIDDSLDHVQFDNGASQISNSSVNTPTPRSAAQNAVLAGSIFGDFSVVQEQKTTKDAKTDLKNLLKIDFDYRSQEQITALEGIYNDWEQCIEGVSNETMDELIPNLHAKMLTNSKRLLDKIVDIPDLALSYTAHSNKLGADLGEFISKYIDVEANYENLERDAFNLMHKFSDFAEKYGDPTHWKKDPPTFGDSALYPVLKAASELMVDDEIKNKLNTGGAVALSTFLQTAENVSREADKRRTDSAEDIQNAVNNIAFAVGAGMEPIRCCLKLAGYGLPVLPQEAAQNKKLSFLNKTNEYVDKFGARWQNVEFISSAYTPSGYILALNENPHLQESFGRSTGIEWDQLDATQKSRAGGICCHLSKAASVTGKDVEKYFTQMGAVILKATTDPAYYARFFSVSNEAANTLREISKNCVNSKNTAETICNTYMRYSKNVAEPFENLLQIAGKNNRGCDLEAISLAAVRLAVKNMTDEEHFQFASNVQEENSVFRTAVNSFRTAKRLRPNEIAPGFDSGPLRLLAVCANEDVDFQIKHKEFSAISPGLQWLNSNQMDQQELNSEKQNETILNNSQALWHLFDSKVTIFPQQAVSQIGTTGKPDLAPHQIISKPDTQNVNLQNTTQTYDQQAALFNAPPQIQHVPPVITQTRRESTTITVPHWGDVCYTLGLNEDSELQKSMLSGLAQRYLNGTNQNDLQYALVSNSQIFYATLQHANNVKVVNLLLDGMKSNILNLCKPRNTLDEQLESMAKCGDLVRQMRFFCDNNTKVGKFDPEALMQAVAKEVGRENPQDMAQLAEMLDNNPIFGNTFSALLELHEEFTDTNQPVTSKPNFMHYPYSNYYVSPNIFSPIAKEAFAHQLRHNKKKSSFGRDMFSSIVADTAKVTFTTHKKLDYTNFYRQLYMNQLQNLINGNN